MRYNHPLRLVWFRFYMIKERLMMEWDFHQMRREAKSWRKKK